MKRLLFLLVFLWSTEVIAKEIIKVAVIDTGLNMAYKPLARLCKFGHKDLTGENNIYRYHHVHGTNVVGLIVNNADTDNYCIIMIKAYPKSGELMTEAALEYAYNLKPDIIHLSGGGSGYRPREAVITKKILDAGIVFVTASGNNYMNLDKTCDFYPACYDSRTYVIGNNAPNSNHGKYVDIVIDGQHQLAFGEQLSGTSQSAAIFTGRLLNKLKDQ